MDLRAVFGRDWRHKNLLSGVCAANSAGNPDNREFLSTAVYIPITFTAIFIFTRAKAKEEKDIVGRYKLDFYFRVATSE